MKNLLLLFFLFTTASAYGEICRDGSSALFDSQGTQLTGTDDLCYAEVKNLSGGLLAIGSVVVVDSAQDSANQVTTSTTSGAYARCIIREACSSLEVCECVSKGVTDVLVNVLNGIATAGKGFYLDTGTAAYVTALADASVVATRERLGYFLDSQSAGAASGLVQAYVDL